MSAILKIITFLFKIFIVDLEVKTEISQYSAQNLNSLEIHFGNIKPNVYKVAYLINYVDKNNFSAELLPSKINNYQYMLSVDIDSDCYKSIENSLESLIVVFSTGKSESVNKYILKPIKAIVILNYQSIIFYLKLSKYLSRLKR